MDSGAMTDIPSGVMRSGSGIRKLMRGYRDEGTQWRWHKPALGKQSKKKKRKAISVKGRRGL